MTRRTGIGSVKTWGVPGRGNGDCYVMPEDGGLAVEVALATGRPLLLRGNPGSGKSSLAAFVAKELDWRYYEHVVTYRTKPTDLLWTYDAVRRLADAQAWGAKGLTLEERKYSYVLPGPLWWAYNRGLAQRRGDADAEEGDCEEPLADLNRGRKGGGAVVLIDEIDKADPDVPNGLLVPLDSGEFRVAETDTLIRMERPAAEHPRKARHLVVITTNEERELPQAFLRRCVVAVLPEPDQDQLVEIVRRHLEDSAVWDSDLISLAADVALEVCEARERSEERGLRPPSTAEYLDTLHACLSLGIRSTADKRWQKLRGFVLVKHQRPGDTEPGGDIGV